MGALRGPKILLPRYSYRRRSSVALQSVFSQLDVRATQSGSTFNGMALAVKVLTGAHATQNGAVAFANVITTPSLGITPNANGSIVYGSIVNANGTTLWTALASTTFIQNISDVTNGSCYGTYRSTATTTASSPITLGASAPSGTAGGISQAEILTSGTLAEHASAPTAVSTDAAQTVATAIFTPPAGSLIVAIVSSDGGVGICNMTVVGGGLTWTELVKANDSGDGYAGVWIARVPGTEAGGLTQTVGQTVETDAAQAITHLKSKLLGQITGTDTAQNVQEVKRKAIGQVTGSDSAQTITPVHILTGVIGQVTETSTSQTVTKRKQKLLGLVSETSTANTVTPRKSRAVAQVTETSAAQALVELKRKLLGQVTETNIAQTVSHRKIKVITQVTESNIAQIVKRVHLRTVAQISETSAPQPVTHKKAKIIGLVSEINTADTVTRAGTATTVSMVTESNTAQPISHVKVKVVSQIVETNTANAIARIKTKLVGQVNEIDLARVIVGFTVPVINRVNETDLALQVSGGVASADTHGWRPLVGLHCVYLQQKTFEGNPNYIKRIPVIITAFASDGYPRLKNKQTGNTYGTASVGIRPRSHPDANEFGVYVSF